MRLFVVVLVLALLRVAAVTEINMDEQVYMEMVWHGQALTSGTRKVVPEDAVEITGSSLAGVGP